MPEQSVTSAVTSRSWTARSWKRRSASVTRSSKRSSIGCSVRTSLFPHCLRLCVLAHRPFLLSSAITHHKLCFREWIETDTNRFQASLTVAFAISRYDQTRREANITESVRDFKTATDQLRNRFDARQSITDDVQCLVEHAAPIDKFMRTNRTTPGAENDWSTLHADLEAL